MFHLFADQFCLYLRQKIWSWISYTALKILTTCVFIILPPPGQAPKTAPVRLSHCPADSQQNQASRAFILQVRKPSVGSYLRVILLPHAIFSSILKTFTIVVSLWKELYLHLEPEERRWVGAVGKLLCREMWGSGQNSIMFLLLDTSQD